MGLTWRDAENLTVKLFKTLTNLNIKQIKGGAQNNFSRRRSLSWRARKETNNWAKKLKLTLQLSYKFWRGVEKCAKKCPFRFKRMQMYLCIRTL